MLVTVFNEAFAVIGGVCDENCTLKSEKTGLTWFLRDELNIFGSETLIHAWGFLFEGTSPSGMSQLMLI